MRRYAPSGWSQQSEELGVNLVRRALDRALKVAHLPEKRRHLPPHIDMQRYGWSTNDPLLSPCPPQPSLILPFHVLQHPALCAGLSQGKRQILSKGLVSNAATLLDFPPGDSSGASPASLMGQSAAGLFAGGAAKGSSKRKRTSAGLADGGSSQKKKVRATCVCECFSKLVLTLRQPTDRIRFVSRSERKTQISFLARSSMRVSVCVQEGARRSSGAGRASG